MSVDTLVPAERTCQQGGQHVVYRVWNGVDALANVLKQFVDVLTLERIDPRCHIVPEIRSHKMCRTCM